MTCTAASAFVNPTPTLVSYLNSTGGTVYELDAPTSWDNIGADPTVLTGAGASGGDAYYKPGTVNGNDDSTRAYWNFTGAALANVGHNNSATQGQYAAQVFVSSTSLKQDGNIVIGSWNGPWGYAANGWGQFSSWNGVNTSVAGWTGVDNWTGGYLWLSNDSSSDMTVSVKWNAWGGYAGCAVSGVRVSTDGNFAPSTPEPSSLLALLAGVPALLMFRRKH